MDLMKLKEMEYNELLNLINAANTELAARRRSMQEEAWKAVKEAICEYTSEFGDIILDYNDYNIPNTCNFNTIGTIFTYKEEKEEY